MALLKDFPVYRSNPYDKKGIGERVIAPKEKLYRRVDDITGEVLGDTPETMIKEKRVVTHDRLSYVKVYKEGLVVMRQLGNPARQILFHVFDVIKPKQEEVMIHYSMFNKMARSQFYSGLIELLSYGVLSRGAYNTYYINPNMFYNGDRTKKKEKKHETI